MKLDSRASHVAETLLVGVSLLVRRIKQTRDDTLSMPETSALVRLETSGPITATALARLERISAQSMGATLSALEERRLIKRTPDSKDGRQAWISITAAGRETLRNRKSARARQFARALSSEFTDEELERLLTAAPLIERLAQRI